MRKKNAVADPLVVEFQKAAVVSPFLILAVLHLLNREQWKDLIVGTAYARLTEDVRRRVRRVLAGYGMTRTEQIDDAVQDVLVKLSRGKFLSRFRPTKGHPCPYVLGSARQLSRTIARSLARQYRRDNGLPPLPSIKRKRTATAPPSVLAA